MTTLQATWAQARAARRPRRRTPLLVMLIAYLARTLPTWKRARSAVMQVAGFAAITYGLFTWSMLAGFVAAGVSLLVLEALGGGDDRNR